MGVGTLRRHRANREVDGDKAGRERIEAAYARRDGLPEMPHDSPGKDVKVDELEAYLNGVSDAELIRAWAEGDSRKTAGPLYEARLEELAPGEGQEAGDGPEDAES